MLAGQTLTSVCSSASERAVDVLRVLVGGEAVLSTSVSVGFDRPRIVFRTPPGRSRLVFDLGVPKGTYLIFYWQSGVGEQPHSNQFFSLAWRHNLRHLLYTQDTQHTKRTTQYRRTLEVTARCEINLGFPFAD